MAENAGGLLDSMRDNGWIALFYEGGWMLIEGEEDLLDWARWPILDKNLEPGFWDEQTCEQLKKLSSILDNDKLPILKRVRDFRSQYEELAYGSTMDSRDRLLTYDDLINDKEFSNEFNEYLTENGLPTESIAANHQLAGKMLCSRYGEPGTWVSPDDADSE
jgi:hypothetical protein